MVFYDHAHQSYSDAKVNSIKNVWHANHAFIFFGASEIEGLDGNA